MKKLLAITPYFGKTGSEIALLNVLNASSQYLDIDVFTPNRQPILGDKLNDSIGLYYPKSSKAAFSEKLKKRISKTAANGQSILERWVSKNDYDYVLLNTLLSLPHFEAAKKLAKKTIAYIHETEAMLPTVRAATLRQILEEVDLVLCSSQHVKTYLITLGRTKPIEVLHPSLDYSNFNTPLVASNLRACLGFEPTDFVWAMVGTMTFNKNPKLFLEIAASIAKTSPQAKFMWIGFKGHRPYDLYMKARVSESKLDEVVKFVAPQDERYFEYLNSINGFVLTSFSESFSLVSVEAACFGKPIVSFPCGGINEAVPAALVKISEEFSVTEITRLMRATMEEVPPALNNNLISRLLETNITLVGDRFINILNTSQL